MTLTASWLRCRDDRVTRAVHWHVQDDMFGQVSRIGCAGRYASSRAAREAKRVAREVQAGAGTPQSLF